MYFTEPLTTPPQSLLPRLELAPRRPYSPLLRSPLPRLQRPPKSLRLRSSYNRLPQPPPRHLHPRPPTLLPSPLPQKLRPLQLPPPLRQTPPPQPLPRLLPRRPPRPCSYRKSFDGDDGGVKNIYFRIAKL